MLLILFVALATEVPGNTLVSNEAGCDFTKVTTVGHFMLLNYLNPSLVGFVSWQNLPE